jgi:23S rRNA pseudouridine2605 synthase
MSVHLNKPESERIQKVLSGQGLGSRREIEGWIVSGRVRVNGHLAKLGDRITLEDRIQIDEKLVFFEKVEKATLPRILLYYKPEGEICSRKDPEGRRTAFDNLPRVRGGRWIMVGRLDINTSGLLLFTTDGELANFLMHPSHEVEREYAVRVLGGLNPAQIEILKKGVMLEDGLARFSSVREEAGDGANRWYHVILQEGRNREIRRMFDALGLQVSRLIRVRYGPLILPTTLSRGKMIELTADETKLFLKNIKAP